ncbi:MAG: aminotransferase class I/II-fold pyridoxal phosphate-dependent enzyme [Proteobacteria bacterium]|nr:aminotransferase class I/II-fold pyridoxal phosphate-dependent enzyme [Pseudomonadota bacterium]
MSKAHLARRTANISPFRVMALLAEARQMEAEGRDIIHLEIGEPDFPTAKAINQAGITTLEKGLTHYTPALGLPELRCAIADSYGAANPGMESVVVTPGASGALAVVFAALLNPGDEVLMADPGYPCNRHFVSLYDGVPQPISVGPETDYQLTAELIDQHWSDDKTVAVLLASPSNPTGTLITDDEMKAIAECVHRRGGVLIVDEIYRGLVYEGGSNSVLALAGEVFVVNSFSKYYGMTGWRVGWLVAPEAYRQVVDHLVQNMFIAASTVGQYAALRALDDDVALELQRRRDIFAQRRDTLLPALRQLGFTIPASPQGAFYIYADCSSFTDDSEGFASGLLHETGVAITPGTDFGHYRANEHVRFSYATDIEQLHKAVTRIGDYLAEGVIKD